MDIRFQLPRIKSGSEELVFKAYGNAWEAKIGRIDGNVVGPNKVPEAGAPVEVIRVRSGGLCVEFYGCACFGSYTGYTFIWSHLWLLVCQSFSRIQGNPTLPLNTINRFISSIYVSILLPLS